MCRETEQLSPEIRQRYTSVPTVMMDGAPFDGDRDLMQDNSLLGGDIATHELIHTGPSVSVCISVPIDYSQAHRGPECSTGSLALWGLALSEG